MQELIHPVDGSHYYDGTNCTGTNVSNTGDSSDQCQIDRALAPASVGYGNLQYGLYLQDDWAVTKQLELNLGIRWDYETNMLNYDYVTNDFLAGTNTVMTAKNTEGTGLFQFSMDYAGPEISDVKVDGVEADYWRETGPDYKNKLVIEPATKIRRDATFTVEVDYAGPGVSIVDPDDTPEGWLRVSTPGYEGSFVVNEPIGSMTLWHPTHVASVACAVNRSRTVLYCGLLVSCTTVKLTLPGGSGTL